MQANQSDHENLPHRQQEKPPVEFSMSTSLKPASGSPILVTDEDKSSNNNVVKSGGDKMGSRDFVNNEARDKKEEMMESVENLNAHMPKPLIVDTENDNDSDLMWTPEYLKQGDSSGEAPKHASIRRSFQRESTADSTRRSSVGHLYFKSYNNNFDEDAPLLTESKAALLDKFLHENERSGGWKRERWANGDFEDLRVRFPWKRIAYIGVLLILGITCAVLVLMKLCGGADWMNTATFSVIIMGTVMLLPPGLYYGRILVCITCRCKGYSLWDVPAGPFG